MIYNNGLKNNNRKGTQRNKSSFFSVCYCYLWQYGIAFRRNYNNNNNNNNNNSNKNNLIYPRLKNHQAKWTTTKLQPV